MTCPTCRTPAAWHGNPNRPFCSLTCRLIDLGTWLDERHRIPSDPGRDETLGASVEDNVVENDVS